ncbi:MAG: RecBCD enzyme subunit RecB [Chlamydiia bacterium]|nr:RecBCD enzyme subunit RecB [Chlamydiia bacterium]
MQEYNVLDPKSSLYGQIFIEASAGTGKTFAIEHMVLRLVLDGICIKKILVVTFTKAGALDLKRRIHSSLLNIADKIRNKELDFGYLSEIKNTDEALLLIENACALSSEMPISTIHSFAFQMLSSFAFEGGISFDLLHFEDEKQQDHALISILDTLRAETTEQTLSAAQCTKMMDIFSRKLSSFTKKVTQIIQNEKNLKPPSKFCELNKQFNKSLENISEDQLLDELVAIAPSYKRATNRNKEIHPNLFKQLKAIVKKDLDILILSSPSITEILQESNLKKGKEIPVNYKLPQIMEQIAPIVKEAKDPMTPIMHIAYKAKERLLKKNVQGPDALLTSMFEAIQRPAFFKQVQSLFSCCIIDEFQDTDPLQWKILSQLFFTSSKLFCTVGDPKQSIYAFRGADLPTYLKAKDLFSNLFSLTTNFRSHELIIDSLNRLFSNKSAPDFLSFEKANDDLKYFQVKAGKKNQSAANISLLLAEPETKRTIRQSLDDAQQHYFFPDIVNKIKDLNIDFDKIAILVKDRYQGLAISLYLQKMKIPVKANISASLLDSSLFSLFETLLLLTYTPRSESLIKKLLTHPIIDAPIDLLKEDLTNPILQQISIDFSELFNILENKGLHNFLFALTHNRIFEGRSLGEILCTKESWYLTMMQIFSLFLTNFEKDPKSFINEIQKLDPEVFTFLKKSCGTDKKSVLIITSHLSKGLEFDAVFALSLYTRMKQTPETEQEAISIDKEKMRLLYVTLTRAKYHLFVYGTVFGSKFPLQKGCGSPLELFLSRVNKPFLDYSTLYQRAFDLSIDELLTDFPIPITILTPQKTSPYLKNESKPIIFDPVKMPSYKKPARTHSFSSLPFEQSEIVKVEAKAEFPYGSAVGNQVHLLLERIIEEGLYHPFDKERIFPIMQRSFVNTPLESFEELIYSKLEEIFKAPFNTESDHFTLEKIPPQHMWGEILFHYNLENSDASIKGFADLILYHSNKYYILDWKCNHLEDYSQETIKHALEHHNYTKQASIYSRALKAFLELKNLSYEENAGGAFYVFVRGGKEGIRYFKPEVMKDEEVICLI